MKPKPLATAKQLRLIYFLRSALGYNGEYMRSLAYRFSEGQTPILKCLTVAQASALINYLIRLQTNNSICR